MSTEDHYQCCSEGSPSIKDAVSETAAISLKDDEVGVERHRSHRVVVNSSSYFSHRLGVLVENDGLGIVAQGITRSDDPVANLKSASSSNWRSAIKRGMEEATRIEN